MDRTMSMSPATSSQSAPGHAPPGVLPAQAIRALVEQSSITLSAPLGAKQLQPASLDLRLGDKAYRVRASFLPGPGNTVESKLDGIKLHEIDLTEAAVLETGCVYIVPLLERLDLPAGLSASANPKSSTGRLDVFTRVIADGGTAFDQIPVGYRGPLYAEICPQTFPVMVRRGSTLSQIRFRTGDASENDAVLATLHAHWLPVASMTSKAALPYRSI
jgi:dCTP deaminase